MKDTDRIRVVPVLLIGVFVIAAGGAGLVGWMSRQWHGVRCSPTAQQTERVLLTPHSPIRPASRRECRLTTIFIDNFVIV